MTNQKDKYLWKIEKQNDDECEGCADHVCNDDCGCELSKAAMESFKKKFDDEK